MASVPTTLTQKEEEKKTGHRCRIHFAHCPIAVYKLITYHGSAHILQGN